MRHQVQRDIDDAVLQWQQDFAGRLNIDVEHVFFDTSFKPKRATLDKLYTEAARLQALDTTDDASLPGASASHR